MFPHNFRIPHSIFLFSIRIISTLHILLQGMLLENICLILRQVIWFCYVIGYHFTIVSCFDFLSADLVGCSGDD